MSMGQERDDYHFLKAHCNYLQANKTPVFVLTVIPGRVDLVESSKTLLERKGRGGD